MITDLTWDRAAHVARNMRADDSREVLANSWDDSHQAFAAECMRLPGPKLACVMDDTGEPVAMGGVAVHLPGVGQAWFVGTDKISPYGLEVTRACKQIVDGLMTEHDIHRVQAFSAAFHTKAHQWLRSIGFVEESTLPAYGRNREDFLIFSILKEH